MNTQISDSFRQFVGLDGDPDPALGLENAEGPDGDPIDLEERDAQQAVGPDHGTVEHQQAVAEEEDESEDEEAQSGEDLHPTDPESTKVETETGERVAEAKQEHAKTREEHTPSALHDTDPGRGPENLEPPAEDSNDEEQG